MNKKIARLVALAAFAVGTMQAGEMRSPYLSERGPLRYTFEKDDSEKYSLSLYSAMHRREAHKAFLDHGTDTKPLTALFFNKADIPLSEIFPIKKDDQHFYEHYNPYVTLGTISPRATYYEWGMNLGGRFEYPIYKDKGRIGVRANIPFRTIEIEHENFMDKNDDPWNKYITTYMVTVKTGKGDTGSAAVLARAVSFELLNQMAYIDSAAGAWEKAYKVEATKNVKLFDKELASPLQIQDDKGIADYGLFAGVITSDANKKPTPTTTRFFTFNADVDHVTKAASDITSNDHHVINPDGSFSTNLTKAESAKGIAFFFQKLKGAGDTAYGTNGAITKDPWLKTHWLVLGRSNGRFEGKSENCDTIDKGIDSWLKRYDYNPYEWLFHKGDFEFETQRRSGLGDIDLDLFYEHRFSDEWMAELMLGVRAPTGSGDDYAHNPYKIHLGNSEHWEIKLGGMVAWMPLDWMNIKLDTYFAFALEATEKRCAAFKPDTDAVTTIKNIGPAVDADVDWQYFVLRLDFNLFHPKTNDLSSVIGYEFYYKTKDDVHFKKSSMETWLGKKWNNTSGGYVDAAEKDLDNGLLERNTQAIGHKIRCETSYRFSDWFEMFCGGSYTFAGRNLPRECDGHGGFNVRF